MQDSIEDYIRISNNTKEANDSDEKKKALLLTVQRKKECERYSQKIVEFLIDGQLRPETFVRCLTNINQELYQDVVVERAITHICGYPLCGTTLPKMPHKQYYISRKVNKVYDITDRKNYCSNFCYKASVHIKAQIETSPLWLRKLENIPNFTLLSYSQTEGSPGEEVNHDIVKVDETKTNFTSVTTFSEYSLDEIDSLEADSRAKQREKRFMQDKTYGNRSKNVGNFTKIREEEEADFSDDEDDHRQEGADDDVSDVESCKFDEEEIRDLTRSLREHKIKDEAKTSANLIGDCTERNSNESNGKRGTPPGKHVKVSLDEQLKVIIEKCKRTHKNGKTVLYTDPLPAKLK